MSEIKYDILKNLGALTDGVKGWKKEVNIISWNDKKAKIDVRDWDEEHEKMRKGITLNKAELKLLKEILNQIDIDELDIE